MNHFCTLFDSAYLSRGVALYRSLVRQGDEFRLYVYCFDDRVHSILEGLGLPGIVPVPLREFETGELLGVKGTRSRGEYCWTCTPHVIRDALDRFGLESVTYLDADLWFRAPPSMLLDELDESGGSILLTEHRFTPGHEKALVRGRYCVQFMTFRNDPRGRRALHWWGDRCLEWCHDRLEEGKFGDQKYLDDWTERFEGVHVLRHPGGGVAPWNAGRYRFEADGEGIVAVDRQSGGRFPLVFYHFHHVRMYDNGRIDLGHFRLPPELKRLAYRPYLGELDAACSLVKSLDPTVDPHGIQHPKQGVFEFLVRCKRWMKGNYPTIRSLKGT